MAEVFEGCIKIYRNLTQKLPYLVAELERSKKAEKKEKSIHKPCMILGPNVVGKDTMIGMFQEKYPEKI